MTERRSETEVLIVGAGPVGLTCSRLLSRLGIDNCVIERRPGLHESPQAHVVSSRTLEIFRAAGIDEAALQAQATPLADVARIVWTHTLSGPALGTLELSASAAASLTRLNVCRHTTRPSSVEHDIFTGLVVVIVYGQAHHERLAWISRARDLWKEQQGIAVPVSQERLLEPLCR